MCCEVQIDCKVVFGYSECFIAAVFLPGSGVLHKKF